MTQRNLNAAVAPDDLLVPLRELRAELEIPEGFSPQAEADAAAAARRPQPGEDRIAIPFITIDPPGSMDLDQAVHLEARGTGTRVRYAIAAVGRLVEPGSALDAEIRARGVTVYGPGHSFPLHPRVLSADAASLLPGAVRSAYVWTIDLDDAGAPVAARVELARVRSVARFTYAEVQAALDAGTELPARRPTSRSCSSGWGLLGRESNVNVEGCPSTSPSRSWRGTSPAATGSTSAPPCPLRARTPRSPCSPAWRPPASCGRRASACSAPSRTPRTGT